MNCPLPALTGNNILYPIPLFIAALKPSAGTFSMLKIISIYDARHKACHITEVSYVLK